MSWELVPWADGRAIRLLQGVDPRTDRYEFRVEFMYGGTSQLRLTLWRSYFQLPGGQLMLPLVAFVHLLRELNTHQVKNWDTLFVDLWTDGNRAGNWFTVRYGTIEAMTAEHVAAELSR